MRRITFVLLLFCLGIVANVLVVLGIEALI
jgi:hypothetical protein